MPAPIAGFIKELDSTIKAAAMQIPERLFSLIFGCISFFTPFFVTARIKSIMLINVIFIYGYTN
jgi:hypothetical protein